jgi:hypothetical protein
VSKQCHNGAALRVFAGSLDDAGTEVVVCDKSYHLYHPRPTIKARTPPAGGIAVAQPSAFARHADPDTTKGRKGLAKKRPDGVRKDLQSLVDVVEEVQCQLDDMDLTPHLAGVNSAVNTLCARLLPQPASFGPPSHEIPLQPHHGIIRNQNNL